jgi:hypothetical protein
MSKKIKIMKAKRLAIGTIISDNEYPEDLGLIVERNLRAKKHAYRVYHMTGNNGTNWLPRDYVENRCSVITKASNEES